MSMEWKSTEVVKAYMAHQERLRKMEFLSHDKKRLRGESSYSLLLLEGRLQKPLIQTLLRGGQRKGMRQWTRVAVRKALIRHKE